MKKVFFLISIFSLTVISASFVKSQEATEEPFQETQLEERDESELNALYQAYLISLEDYKKAREEYVLKRSQYLRFKTLTARQEAQDATRNMLSSADDVVTTFLLALTLRQDLAIGVTEGRVDVLILRIEDEIFWFDQHRANLDNAGTLEELESDSKEAVGRWLRVEPLIYEVLAEISYGRVTDFSGRVDEIFAGIKAKLEEIRTDPREEYTLSEEKFQILDRWIFQTEGKLVRSRLRAEEAREAILKMPRVGQGSGEYDSILSKLGDSQISLKEATSFMRELINEIKRAD